ncbi:Fasciclin-domain-containing protein [Fragilariopsis cylindrus CCMP1102]|uniref:Fasciclin-domain-containing protein n=1 Tax=Fragilariopsis cylindrus CCMP1102 TaxID=635003 RepID=A0A1E7EQY0_9STRA|nr:Fasciclin-domain-containing protein [Fragilariopsis cylindrus CCMP1102]|eukprot:OEU08226.1 Fasciclin-domain-containing protein [Fragilariopsis cylindrus CCMP1102]
MKLSSACLRITITSSVVLSVLGHATLIDPAPPKRILTPCGDSCAEFVADYEPKGTPKSHLAFLGYNAHWFTTGTAPGCNATGENPIGKWGFCEELMEPTLKSIDQISNPKFYFDGDCDGEKKLAAYHYKNDTKECVKDMEYRQAEVDKGNVSASVFSGNPWFVPGTAAVVDSCGVLGGWKYENARDFMKGPNNTFFSVRNDVNGDMPPKYMNPPAGTLGSTVLSETVNMRMQDAQGKSAAAYPVVWTAGEIVEGAYNVGANHGGGHQYRLCPVENLNNNTLDESCFQSTVMEFANDRSLFIAMSDDGTVIANITFDAMDIDDGNTDGVMPKGSTWRKIGIPACAGWNLGTGNSCTRGPQFTDHAPPGYYGLGGGDPEANSPDLQAVLSSSKIIDKLEVPEGLSGDYVVSWRWDAEQSAQVWTSCAIVTIVDPENMLGDGDSNNNDNDKCETLYDIVCDSNDFSLFCDALKAASLDSSFDEETWTVFIPNNEAIESAGELGLESMSNDAKTNILMFHAVAGKVLSSDDLKCTEKVQMFNGDSSRTKCNNDAMYQNGAGNDQLVNSAQIIQTDIKFCNGVAHVVDGVMFPKFY